MPLYLHFPRWLKPEIIPGLPLHWYGLMYIIAFGLAYALFRYQTKGDKHFITDDDTASLFLWGIAGLLLGARILAVTIYDPSGIYLSKPWLIFWPFDSSMRLVGLSGMSYHGGVIGAVVGVILYCRKKKFSFWEMADLIVAGIPLGYTFGRLGNFINGELWGRVTTVPWGMVFPAAPGFSASDPWAKGIAADIGMNIPAAAARINLPRHPSQLYEAFFEGIFLWAVLWFVFRKRKKWEGQLLSIYLIGYGLVRFIIEYFREPDRDIGFVIALGPGAATPHIFSSLLNISTGQILCFLMILAGVLMLFFVKSRAERRAVIEQEEKKHREISRKTRKRLKGKH